MKHEALMKCLQLRASMILAAGSEEAEQITSLAEPPPCFDGRDQFKGWLRLAAVAPPPRRKDFPAEPNYCRDCTPEHQDEMKKQGRCLFPMVRFQIIKDHEGDEEVVGYTPKRFLPQTRHGSYGHRVVSLGQGLYRTTLFVAANGSEQSRVVDREAALKFSDRWGVAIDEAPAEDLE